MRLGVISDVHGNLVALETVVDDMPTVDGIVCAGDVVGYGPWPGECIDALREGRLAAETVSGEGPGPDGGDAPTVMGNHDRAVATDTAFRFNAMAKAGVEFARERCTDEQIEWVASLPDRRTECDGRVKLVHGHPDDVDRYTYPREFSGSMIDDEDVLVLGHTHVQGYETFEEGIVLNPGSVGQPRDGDPKAAYAVVDLQRGTVDCHRVAYDIERVQHQVDIEGLPRKIGTRLEEGR